MSSYCKFYKEKKQVSYDNGITFIDVTPTEYRKGELIERDSPDCGYVPPTPPASGQYLTFVAIDSGTFSFSGTSSSTIDNSSIQYSTDNGSTWSTLNRGVQSPTITAGNKIMWKSTTLQPINDNTYSIGVGRFSSTGRFNVEGNIMSLLYGDNFIGQTSLYSKSYVFENLFSGNTNVVSAENLILPATTLAEWCYSYMFAGCTSLTTAPALPATTLANYCYNYMFQDCTSLTTAPQLSATTLAVACYNGMFYGCTSLTTAPALPATTLANYCYSWMFYGCSSLTTAPDLNTTNMGLGSCSWMFAGCTSLTTAPALPATTLASDCYYNMFKGCTSLTAAPVLSATTLVGDCYYGMFAGCTSLNYIKCLATDISAENCTTNWLDGVSSSGTFVKASSMNSWPSGTSGIPLNWTIQNA